VTKRPNPNLSPEFRLGAAQLVVDQKHSIREAADAMNVAHWFAVYSVSYSFSSPCQIKKSKMLPQPTSQLRVSAALTS